MPSGWQPAEIHTVDFVAGARNARGLTVVIDVFRAFSLAPHAFARGARAIVPIADVEEARQLKRLHPDWLLIGERHARPLPGFAGAIVRYIRKRAPAVVTLVRMGKQAQERCADSAAMFFDPACDRAPQRDFELCTRVDAFDFVLRLERGERPARLERIEVSG